MRGRPVRSPDGTTWVVRRRWSSRLDVPTAWKRARRRTEQSTRGATTAGDVSLASALLIDDGAVLVRWAIIAVVAVVLVFMTTLLLVVEVALLALVVLAGMGSRVVLRRPWTIEAVSDTGDRLTWKAVGWRASAARRDEVAEQLRSGRTPEPEDAPSP
jgi:hypothetical protein